VATRSKKPESVAKEVADKREERESQAHFYPLAGTVSSCTILDQQGGEVFSAAGGFDNTEGSVSHQALTTLGSLLATGGTVIQAPTLYDIGVPLFGLKIRDRLRIMAIDAIRYSHQNDLPVSAIPVSLWYHRPFEAAPWCDPYEAAVPSERRNDIPYDGLCEYLGIEMPQGVNPDTDAKLQAELARQLTIKLGLIGP